MPGADRLVEQQYAMLLRRDVARLPDLYATDAFYSMPGVTVRPIELPALLRTWTGAFPDLVVDPIGSVQTAGGAAVEQRLTGTHTGVLHTPFGTVAPTGRVVSWDVVDVVRVRRGRIAAWRSYFDWGQLIAALGLHVDGLSREAQHDPLGLPV
ncbi:ester cyclase [Micromonospora peucetia]|uniref:Ester cyclase n=1 Tax=Micromonospora peucetia TaxID=47871 RepID=A0A1C6UYW8_9ACTN|nr:ester cyclase [Micromonospora peucetia]MCX4387759.1 ester cyclase [Micromonospora peucetia]WSA35072.1 ester cyclase [Micromonospora peucetia]SCL59221.1 Ketosteroid isomerase-related protein [Micromonospora peucetia]